MDYARLYDWARRWARLPADPDIAADAIPRLERLLLENLIPFWYPAVLDRRVGGYRMGHGRDGRWRDPPHRHVVGQAETAWFFARLAASPYGTAEHLDAARHGIDFLAGKMWDHDHGGVFWVVDDDGAPLREPARDDNRADVKNMLGQAYALYAFAQYALASGDAAARRLAETLFDLIEAHARDRESGGVIELLDRDWSPAPAGMRNALHGGPPTEKGFGAQVHLIEGLLPYLALTGDARAHRLLTELMTATLGSIATGLPRGHIVGQLSRGWRPLGHPDGPFIIYGHELEMVMLLIESCRVLDLAPAILSQRLRRTLSLSMRGGFDRRSGGFYFEGRPWDRATDRHKIDWVQAEALLACLWIHRVTGEGVAAHAFNRTLDWIETGQADWARGGWHNEIRPDGTATGEKASDWHSPYHMGRALLTGLDLLSGRA